MSINLTKGGAVNLTKQAGGALAAVRVGLIMAGLAVGAVWVRSLTVRLVETGSLGKYRYLAHGAHYAIGALALVMLGRLYHVELPDWAVGSLGLVFVALAVGSSLHERRRANFPDSAGAAF